MCTLWQRFGRGARGLGLEAIALFLVEPMYFDEVKEQKAERTARKDEKKKQKVGKALTNGKRKLGEHNDSQQLHKKRRIDPTNLPIATSRVTVTASGSHTLGHLTAAQMNTPHALSPNQSVTQASTLARLRMSLVSHSFLIQSPQHSTIVATNLAGPSNPSTAPELDQERDEQQVESDSDSEPEPEQVESVPVDLFDERRVVYVAGAGQRLSERKGRKKKDGNELEPVMDDMINAGSANRRFRCFRHPPMLYFGNDKIGQCPFGSLTCSLLI